MEAPINTNDEGPLALWTAKNQQGPFTFKGYVLDGGADKTPSWDGGRYSESRVWYASLVAFLSCNGDIIRRRVPEIGDRLPTPVRSRP